MKRVLVALAVFGLGLSTAAAQSPGGMTFSNSSTCKTIELKPGESAPLATPMASLPTAGRRSAGGMAGQIPSGSQADGSSVIIDAGGNCTIYRNAERQPNPSR